MCILLKYQRGSYWKHEALKELILEDPAIVGIHKKNVISVETEYPLRKRKRSVTARPDIAIKHVQDNSVYMTFIEVKSGSCRRAKINLQQQLRKINNYVRRQKLRANVIGVYPSGKALTIVLP